MTRVVINSCHGGFGLSHEAMLRFAEIKEIDIYPEKGKWHCTYWLVPENERVKSAEGDAFYAMSIPERQAYNALCEEQTIWDRDIPRDDPALVQVVEEMAEKANGRCARLDVIEIPDDVEWQIEEYDGLEHIAEKHRTWS
jgi:hypothetical protein